MQSQITNVEAKGVYTNASGTFNKYQVTFKNGKSFQMLAKGEFKKNVGDSVEYEITSQEYNTARLVYKPLVTGPKDQLIIRQSMVKAACEFHSNRPTSDVQTVLADAEILINFINK